MHQTANGRLTLGPVHTTPQGVGTTRGDPSRPLDTLEAMHRMLNRSFGCDGEGIDEGREGCCLDADLLEGVLGGAENCPESRRGQQKGQGRADAAVGTAGRGPAAAKDKDGAYLGLGAISSRQGAGAGAGAGQAACSAGTSSSSSSSSAAAASSSSSATAAAAAVSGGVARVWVVRYVDYTSKYGLGFLLSTGSAGVYFNDSTKIVLSACGLFFQYIERRRRPESAASAAVGGAGSTSSASEHVIQTHLMSAYPVELQKKVTLLRHFRNYLVDQHKSTDGAGADGVGAGAGAGAGAGGCVPLVVLPEASNSGANAAIAFGTSSAVFCLSEAEKELIHGLGAGAGTAAVASAGAGAAATAGDEMPFLKKWVRTRHAILFRLSNRTVQVVFFDRSEVLLSSEARVVTYVNKLGVREEHSLEEVLHTGEWGCCVLCAV